MVWILSSKVVVVKLLNVLAEDRGSVPSRRVHGDLGTPTWCPLAHMLTPLSLEAQLETTAKS